MAIKTGAKFVVKFNITRSNLPVIFWNVRCRITEHEMNFVSLGCDMLDHLWVNFHQYLTEWYEELNEVDHQPHIIWTVKLQYMYCNIPSHHIRRFYRLLSRTTSTSIRTVWGRWLRWHQIPLGATVGWRYCQWTKWDWEPPPFHYSGIVCLILTNGIMEKHRTIFGVKLGSPETLERFTCISNTVRNHAVCKHGDTDLPSKLSTSQRYVTWKRLRQFSRTKLLDRSVLRWTCPKPKLEHMV